MIDHLIRARFIVFAATLLLLAGLLALGKSVAYEQSIQSFFAERDPDIVAYRKASDAFGNDNVIFICYDDPDQLTPAGIDRVRDLARLVGPQAVPGILDVQSLDAMPVLWRLDDGLLAISRLPKMIRTRAISALKSSVDSVGSSASLSIGEAIRHADAKTLANLKRRILSHPLINGTLIDSSGKTVSVVVRLRRTDEFDMKATVAAVRSAADSFAKARNLPRPAIVGPPVLLADGFANIERDGRRLAILGMALIGLVTFTATRSVWWAVVPILAGWVVWLTTETILNLLGLKLSLSGGPLVAQIIVLTMPAASHLAIHFRDHFGRDSSRHQAARATLAAVSIPILWCAVTGAIGYGVLLTSNLVPIRQFGAILGACTLIAALLTMAIAPFAMLPPWAQKNRKHIQAGTHEPPPKAMSRLMDWVEGHAWAIVAGVLVIVVPAAMGITRLEYESNYINVFRSNTRVVTDYRFVESRLGGIGLFVVVVPVDEGLNAEALDRLDQFNTNLKQSTITDPRVLITQVVTPATVLDPDRRLARESKALRSELLATKLDLISTSRQADLMKGFWNPDLKWARILVRIPEQQPAGDKEREFRSALDQAKALFGRSSFLTGLSFLMTRTARGVVATQWSTMIASIGGILLMLALALRNAKLAVLALMPSLLAILLVLGLMGWTGIKLDIATALVASVALGLSVDDTFHCLLQFRRQRALCSFETSLRSSYEVTGPGVLLSSLAIAVGFAALWFSEFVPFSNFGLMVCIATAGSSLGNLILLPACLVVGERLGARTRARETRQTVESGKVNG